MRRPMPCISRFGYLSIYLSISLSLYLSLYLSISLSISIYLPVCLSVCLSVSISIYLLLSLSISFYLCAHQPTLSISISLHLYLSTATHLSISICRSILYFFFIYVYISRSFYLSLDLSIDLYIYTSIICVELSSTALFFAALFIFGLVTDSLTRTRKARVRPRLTRIPLSRSRLVFSVSFVLWCVLHCVALVLVACFLCERLRVVSAALLDAGVFICVCLCACFAV
jgi:hypothetical protein